MKLDEAKAIIEALVTLRESATDEQAAAVPSLYPAWKESKVYAPGSRVLHNGTLYKVLQDHTSQSDWTPDAAPSLFAKVLPGQSGEVGKWVQPDSTNPYMLGDKVTHKDKTWECTCDNNVWEPGVYGWTEVI